MQTSPCRGLWRVTASDTDDVGELQLSLPKGQSCRQTGAQEQHCSMYWMWTIPIPSTFSHPKWGSEGGNAPHLPTGDPHAPRPGDSWRRFPRCPRCWAWVGLCEPTPLLTAAHPCLQGCQSSSSWDLALGKGCWKPGGGGKRKEETIERQGRLVRKQDRREKVKTEQQCLVMVSNNFSTSYFPNSGHSQTVFLHYETLYPGQKHSLHPQGVGELSTGLCSRMSCSRSAAFLSNISSALGWRIVNQPYKSSF